MINQTPLVQFIQKGKLSPALLFFSPFDVQFAYISGSFEHIENVSPFSFTMEDAAEMLRDFRQIDAEEKITVLQHQFQQFPWWVRWYYSVLRFTLWCPFFPLEHRKECERNETVFHNLLNVKMDNTTSAYRSECEKAWDPYLNNLQTVRHDDLLDLGSKVYLFDGQFAISRQEVSVWEEVIVGWFITKPLYRADVDVQIVFFTQSGKKIIPSPGEPGRFTTENAVPVFLSKSGVSEYVLNQLSNVKFSDRVTFVR